mmetsp:Transcript_45056/g.70626  ORF Transcript_45056/g.70626 Transcript_45056/m.70626 type:complete len:139 (-) Transcript_45056:1600-2016(-)
MTVFRGVTTDPIKILGTIKHDLMFWDAFSSTSDSRHVAMAFMIQQNRGGVIFKIRARTTRNIMQYSYKPLEREFLLPPQRWFTVKGTYQCTDYNLGYGVEDDNSSGVKTVSLVPMRTVLSSEISTTDRILILLEEVES